MTRLLICGGRNFGITSQQQAFIKQTLDKLCWDNKWILEPDEYGNYLNDVFVIAGKAKGVDTVAIDWAISNWCGFVEYPAQWDLYGKRAGYLRNQQMLDEGKPDYVIAFPGGKGTAMMIRIAEKAGVPVFIIKE